MTTLTKEPSVIEKILLSKTRIVTEIGWENALGIELSHNTLDPNVDGKSIVLLKTEEQSTGGDLGANALDHTQSGLRVCRF